MLNTNQTSPPLSPSEETSKTNLFPQHLDLAHENRNDLIKTRSVRLVGPGVTRWKLAPIGGCNIHEILMHSLLPPRYPNKT
jgi:hypothetical protein